MSLIHVGVGQLIGKAAESWEASKDAKKCYTQATAAVLRAKTDVMATASKVRENCDDILADAKEINEQRAIEAEAAVIADECEKIADTSEE